MPRETLNIKKFESGAVFDPPASDVPNDAFTEGSKNTVPTTVGEISSIRKSTSVTTTGAITALEKVQTPDGRNDVFWGTDSSLGVIKDIDGSPSKVFNTTLGAYNMYRSLNGVAVGTQISTPSNQYSSDAMWIGIPDHGQFGNPAPTAYKFERGGIEPPSQYSEIPLWDGQFYIDSVSTFNDVGGRANWVDDYAYLYVAISLVYDGYQESPIGHGSYCTPSSGDNVLKVVIGCKGAASDPGVVNSRVTGINIYVKGATSGTSSWDMYRYTASVDINESDSSESCWRDSGDNKIIDYYIGLCPNCGSTKPCAGDSEARRQETYEAATGLPVTQKTATPNWRVGINTGSYAIVGDITWSRQGYHVNYIEDSRRILLRSLENRPEMFHITRDILRLEYIPKALAYYRGRVYAFDSAHATMINPGGFYIEEEIANVGADNQNAVTVTSNGIWFANNDSCYYSDGRNVVDLMYGIINNVWGNTSGDIVVTPYTRRSSILFIKGNSVYAYNYKSKRWDYWSLDLGSDTVDNAIETANDVYLFATHSGAGYVYKLEGDSTYEGFTYVSKEFDFDEPEQYKKFYRIRLGIASFSSAYYSLDGGDTWLPITSTDMELNAKAKSIRIKVNATSELDYIEIIYRRMVGKR